MIAAGQSFGNYRILNKIGTGGMGAVYLAEHPLIGKRVALKVIHRELASNRDVVSRFFQEARAVNKIGNEHIVEVHDFGVTADGDHFFIMEYLEGTTLSTILARESVLEVMRSLRIGAQIASALADAHAAGIVHRDLKPDNIMLMARLGEQDFVKVLDFGLAKVFSAATAVKTAAGVLLGTPQYMSPEACESRGDVDHRTDIYALGVLLFQMMTGALPFDGETMGDVLVKQVTVLPPAPRALNPAIPPSVEQILLRCLAKPVAARFATMHELLDALLDPEAYLHGSPPIAPARSVGPGEALVDSKTVMMHVAQQPNTRLAAPNPVPVPPPPPPPLPGPATSQVGGPAAPTIIADHREYAQVKRPTAGMSALASPQEPKMNTMRIATPLGYSSLAPRRVWPVVIILALLFGVGGGAFAVAWFGHGSVPARFAGSAASDDPPAAGSADPATSRDPVAGSDGPGPGAVENDPASVTAEPSAGRATGSAGDAVGVSAPAGSASANPPPPNIATAHLSIDSVPPGATVTGPDGETLGKTPLKLAWPVSDLPVTFELKLAGYKRKLKQTVVNSNTAVRIELDRSSVRTTGGATGSGSAADRRGGNALMRPD